MKISFEFTNDQVRDALIVVLLTLVLHLLRW
jgi:hypothetical protein